ncbi:MAG: YfhO family protein [Candidatus Omnitrophica bacterium]|nr:YfhO family protein [Candidatus Omnitrophota bacterium]
MKRYFPHFPVLAALIIPIVIYHWRILFHGEILCGGDMINQFVPWREFALQEIKQGRFPIWNPYVFCGAPFAANIQTSLFYPWNMFNLLFSVERTFSLSLVFHHLLAGAAMYAFLHRLWNSRGGALLGALAYCGSGFFITHGHDGHLIHIRAYALLPLALYCQTAWRNDHSFRWLSLFSLSLAGLFYAGHTQIPLYAFYLLFFRALWHGAFDFYADRKISSLVDYPLWTLAGQALAVGLAAFVLLPLVELSRETAGRSGGANYEFAASDSMPPQHAITLLAPFFFGNPVSEIREEQFWETRTGYHEICGYAGVLPLLLAGFAFLPSRNENPDKSMAYRRECLFFALIAIGGLVFSLGNYTPLYKLLYYGLPGWSYFRAPGRLLLLFILGISVLSARGFQQWKQIDAARDVNRWPVKLPAIATIVFFLGTVILLSSKPAILHWLREFEIDRTITELGLWSAQRSAISRQLPPILFQTRYAWMIKSMLIASGWLAASWIVLYWVVRTRVRHRWLPPALLLMIDLFLFASHFTRTLPAERWSEVYFPQSELIQQLITHSGGSRILCLDDAIGYPVINHHPELRPNRLMHYGVQTVRGYDPIILRSYSRFINRLYDKEPDAPQGGLLFFPTIPPQDALNNMNVRLILTSQSLPDPYQEIWRDAQSGLRIYENPDCRAPLFLEKSSPGAFLKFEKITPSQIQIEVNLSEPNRIMASQNFYKGWKIISADHDIQLERRQETFMEFQAPAGKSLLALQISPFSLSPLSSFTLGGIITLISGVLAIWGLIKRNRII